jgi:acyl-CoA synthetase (AMP-forming)/AMP-acid ligase II
METVSLEVVDAAREPVPEGVVGEVALAGPSRFSRYLELPEVTAEALRGEWFLTGDSGFLFEGELFVLGRLVDLVIVRGRKYFPGFIEEVVHQLAGVKRGRAVAFGVRSEAKGTEELAVLAESEAAADPAVVGRLKREIRREVLQRVDCVVDHVRILPVGSLVKTSSGKLARRDNQARFLAELGRG